MQWNKVEQYKRGILKNAGAFWFVFSKGGMKMGCFGSKEEAMRYVDMWEGVYNVG
jgi:hypothetical protein